MQLGERLMPDLENAVLNANPNQLITWTTLLISMKSGQKWAGSGKS
jgi:hypothetical protein